ncbi:hypothetical protein PR048_033673 [Dryococelus australis]|uniref:Uncharacterized protein n=1 Tax=Dryococelus australis TaxID=614101 RepID=A0ABQ9G0Z2_9NEOP|nr:hypothetical protein PR048_033673 [Dryococelus australis]
MAQPENLQQFESIKEDIILLFLRDRHLLRNDQCPNIFIYRLFTITSKKLAVERAIRSGRVFTRGVSPARLAMALPTHSLSNNNAQQASVTEKEGGEAFATYRFMPKAPLIARHDNTSNFHPPLSITLLPVTPALLANDCVYRYPLLHKVGNFPVHLGATVAERLARSPPTMANRVQSLAGFSRVGIVPEDAVGQRVFSGSHVSPTLSFRRCSIRTSITHIGSQDLAVKSRPNLFTRPMHLTSLTGTWSPELSRWLRSAFLQLSRGSSAPGAGLAAGPSISRARLVGGAGLLTNPLLQGFVPDSIVVGASSSEAYDTILADHSLWLFIVVPVHSLLIQRGRGGLTVRLFASHQGEPGSIHCRITTRFSHVGIVLDYAAGWRVSSVVSLFPSAFHYRRCFTLTLPHPQTIEMKVGEMVGSAVTPKDGLISCQVSRGTVFMNMLMSSMSVSHKR